MLRVGLAGYGLAGREFHAPLLARAGLEVAAVATSNPERRAEASTDLPGARLVDDLDALLRVEGLDLVVLATPTGRHAEHARRVVDAGLPVVVDKPLAVGAREALAVVEHAAGAGVPLTVFQNRRYDAPFATLLEVVRSRAVGEPFRLELRWERWRPEPKRRWREVSTAAEGGGLLLDLHAHLVDAAVRCLGPVETVFATVASRTTVAEDDALLLCRHAGGAVSHLGATSLAGAPGPLARLLGDAGAYVVAGLEGEPSSYPDLADADEDHCGWIVRGVERVAVPRVPADEADFYRQLAVALGTPDPQAAMPVDPRDAVHALAVIDAARESAAGERVVRVDRVVPLDR